MAPTGALQLSALSHGHLQWYQSLPLLQVVVFLWNHDFERQKQKANSVLTARVGFFIGLLNRRETEG